LITNRTKKIKDYITIANKAGYLIWGVDNLKNYTHKLYLVLYRSDVTKTILKALNSLNESITKIMLDEDEFNEIVQTDKCKIVAVKNLGLSNKIIEIIRGEDGK